MIITLSGLPGAGKSTLKDNLAKALGMKGYSMGDLRGKMAQERGITIDELNALGMEDKASDAAVDAFQTELGQKEDNFIIDGAMSWHFIPNSFKIFVTVDPQIGAERIFTERQTSETRGDEPLYTSVEETKIVLKQRITQTQARLKKWYGVDFLDPAHYDAVIDTSSGNAEEILSQARKLIDSRKNA